MARDGHGDLSLFASAMWLLLFNPIVVVNYARIVQLAMSCVGGCAIIGYLFVCYTIFVLAHGECALVAYDNMKRYNRGSIPVSYTHLTLPTILLV